MPFFCPRKGCPPPSRKDPSFGGQSSKAKLFALSLTVRQPFPGPAYQAIKVLSVPHLLYYWQTIKVEPTTSSDRIARGNGPKRQIKPNYGQRREEEARCSAPYIQPGQQKVTMFIYLRRWRGPSRLEGPTTPQRVVLFFVPKDWGALSLPC